MKLVDILARELKVWPEGECFAWQDFDRRVRFSDSNRHDFFACSMAEDNIRYKLYGNPKSGVTRAEWQAAVDALNAPKVVEWPESEYPAVGTVCEFMKHNCPPKESGAWIVGDIRYFSDCTVVIGGDGFEHVHHPRNLSFRPIRTAEQLAAEERENGIQAIQDAYTYTVETCTHKILHSQAARLYDAGCRLQVKK